jgi:NAD(P)H-dependent flavin oxidoreductase YrpB (nitropropane dioxygenase family)
MIWNTKITQMMNITYPLIMGAFGGWGKAEFASHFSNAGGLGIIAALNFPEPEDFKKDLKLMKDLTSKPFGVNLSLPHHEASDKSSQKEIEERYLNYVEIALNEGCNIYTTSGYKAKFIGDRVHEAGAYWIHKCVLLKHALSTEKQGADAVTIVGLEGTGFKNPFTTTTLVNITMAKKLMEIPVIAAGGIGDARGFLATLLMGAEGVCLGTALMATVECPVPKNIKEKWLKLDTFSEDFYKKIYHYNIKNFMAPSTAIAHRNEIIPMKQLIQDIMNISEKILISWGFNNNKFDTTDS